MSAAFLSAAEARRTNHSLTAESTLSNAQLQALIESCVKQCPTAFNTQTGRAVLLLGEKNQELWSLVKMEMLSTMLAKAPPAMREMQVAKMDGYSKGYGSILFFEDSAIVAASAAKNPGLAASFPVWSSHSAGILHYLVWTALSAEGLGASLQHHGSYTPTIPEGLSKLFGIPETWTSTAILPFGKPASPPAEKTFAPLSERVLVFGA